MHENHQRPTHSPGPLAISKLPNWILGEGRGEGKWKKGNTTYRELESTYTRPSLVETDAPGDVLFLNRRNPWRHHHHQQQRRTDRPNYHDVEARRDVLCSVEQRERHGETDDIQTLGRWPVRFGAVSRVVDSCAGHGLLAQCLVGPPVLGRVLRRLWTGGIVERATSLRRTRPLHHAAANQPSQHHADCTTCTRANWKRIDVKTAAYCANYFRYALLNYAG